MKGLFNTEETQSWYNEALRKIRHELADQARHGKFSDHLINALACIQATSVSAKPSFCALVAGDANPYRLTALSMLTSHRVSLACSKLR